MNSDDNQMNEHYRIKLKRILNGYKETLDATDEVCIIGLDALSKGRESIVYYSERTVDDLVEKANRWADTFLGFYFNKKTEQIEAKLPALFWQIVNYAYGVEEEDEKYPVVHKKIKAEMSNLLVNSLLDGTPFPREIKENLVKNAGSPHSYRADSRNIRMNWESVLSAACAAIVKYRIDMGYIKKEEGESKIMLDTNNRDRSYLYGRLLAVFDRVEGITLLKSEKSRETNAMRMYEDFCRHPARASHVLYEQLEPYFEKLTPGARVYYRNLIGEIAELFKPEDKPVMNRQVTEDFFLGFNAERMQLRVRKKSDDVVEIENDNDDDEESEEE